MNKNTLPDTTCNNLPPYDGWMTVQQVLDLLTAVQRYSNANHNQGLVDVAGKDYYERAQTMLNSFLTSNSSKECPGKFETPLDEYMS